MNKQIEKLKEVLNSIQSRVDSMCKDLCEKDGLDYDKIFVKKDGQKETDNIKNSVENDKVDDDKETKSEEDKIEDGNKVENKDEKNKKFVAHESIGGMYLYDRAKFIFEAVNGFNEDGSDYGFSDYIRESLVDYSKEKELCESIGNSVYFGGRRVVNEAKLSSDEFKRRYNEWKANGSKLEDLSYDKYASPDNEDTEFRKIMLHIGGQTNKNRIDRNEDGFISQKEYKKYIENNTDMSGYVPNEVLLKNGLKEMKYGVNRYLNKFMPMSWITGTENAIGKAAGKVKDKISNSKVGKLYKTAGGNKALALGTLGGLAFGPLGALGGALLGKGLQKVVNYGNGVR